jgi:hypothetical protein
MPLSVNNCYSTMKVIPFRIPKTSKEANRMQVGKGKHFYENLHQHFEL